MTYTIYSIGNADFLATILNSVAMVTGNGDFKTLVKIGAGLGILGVFFASIVDGGKTIEWHTVFAGVLLIMLFFIPKTDVVVHDVYTDIQRPVANVPIGPAMAGSIITSIGHGLMRMSDTAYGNAAPKLSENQFADSLKILTQLRRQTETTTFWAGLDSVAGGGWVNLKVSWTNYIKSCALTKVDMGFIKPEEVSKLPVAEVLKFESSLHNVLIYTDPLDASGQDVTCKYAWDTLIDKTAFFTGDDTDKALGALFKIKSNEGSAIEKVGQSINLFLNGGTSTGSFMLANATRPILEKAAKEKYSDNLDLANALMVTQAIQQRNIQWAAEQSLFMTTVRPLIAFFEGLIFSITPFMAFIIVLGKKGLQLAAKYFTFLVWIQLWFPILSIINLYIFMGASGDLANFHLLPDNNWDSYYSVSNIGEITQTWVATGGRLAAMTPVIALMLMTGAAVTATSVASRLQGGDHINEKYSSPDTTSTPPLVNRLPGLTSSYARGTFRTDDSFVSLGSGTDYSSNITASKQEAKALSRGIGSDVASVTTDNVGSQAMKEIATTSSKAVDGMTAEQQGVINKVTDQIIKGTSLTNDHKEGLQSAVAASIAGDVSAGEGKNMATMPGLIKSVFGVGATIKGGGSASTSATNTDSETATVKTAIDESIAQMKDKGEFKKFQESYGEAFSKSSKEGGSASWTNSDSFRSLQNYQDQNSITDSYNQAQGFSAKNAATLSVPINTAAHQLPPAQKAALSKETTERAASNPEFAQNLEKNRALYAAKMDGDNPDSRAAANLATLFSPSSYNRPEDQLSGYQSAMKHVMGSQGFNPSVDSSKIHPSQPLVSPEELTPITNNNNIGDSGQSLYDKIPEGNSSQPSLLKNQYETNAEVAKKNYGNTPAPTLSNGHLYDQGLKLAGAAVRTYNEGDSFNTNKPAAVTGMASGFTDQAVGTLRSLFGGESKEEQFNGLVNGFQSAGLSREMAVIGASAAGNMLGDMPMETPQQIEAMNDLKRSIIPKTNENGLDNNGNKHFEKNDDGSITLSNQTLNEFAEKVVPDAMQKYVRTGADNEAYLAEVTPALHNLQKGADR